ncbi:MAG: 4-(cytidine 5'-diphospho)-2-C-methyl-D-erythritol kinase [Methylococcales symbiont of Iophon sp. n. MRB-2018]|nr:MAG: 4-(cytidine 5'-diphospho)-2-C-methyl-D-erythritol kinase [Methylococcales symbiont of Iophon sp. n. MRB-2018]KAF3978861.1 MAG: 4-(cytidine 5'-diphospho)-2-C-methyl-D-erythritol kinase [Methylococcales symbiont of Iophon sp. n. MRB-2018]
MASWSAKWPAPAKINLMLRITGQREDGYHLLQTVFQLVDWCDWLTFHPVQGRKIGLISAIPGVSEETDLTVRAAKLLQQETGCQQGVLIEIEKNLPMGGGLGGGSSDAATTLMALNALWGLGLSQEELMRIGLQLGADVPVFVLGHSAWAEGVGEKLKKIEVEEKWLLIIKPDCHVDTKEIFSVKELTRDSKPITMAGFISGQHQNDCLDVVRKLYQPVQDALDDLAVFSKVRLTGTGACVFAQFDSKPEAQKTFELLRDKWQVYLAKGINRSPLQDMLN